MKGEKTLFLGKHEDLESFVFYLQGRKHRFIKHRYTPGIYIIDLRPESEKPKKQKYGQLSFDFREYK